MDGCRDGGREDRGRTEGGWREDRARTGGGRRDEAVPLPSSDAARGQKRSDGRQPLPALAAGWAVCQGPPDLWLRPEVRCRSSPRVTASSGTPSSRRHASPAACFLSCDAEMLIRAFFLTFLWRGGIKNPPLLQESRVVCGHVFRRSHQLERNLQRRMQTRRSGFQAHL